MTNYKVTNFNQQTSDGQRKKLEANLKAIEGVNSVKLDADSSEVSLELRSGQPPKRDVVAAAISKSGFTLAQKP